MEFQINRSARHRHRRKERQQNRLPYIRLIAGKGETGLGDTEIRVWRSLHPALVARSPVLDALGFDSGAAAPGLEDTCIRCGVRVPPVVDEMSPPLDARVSSLRRRCNQPWGQVYPALDAPASSLDCEDIQAGMRMLFNRVRLKVRPLGGPKARIHTSLGQRPRSRGEKTDRAESPISQCCAWAGLSALGLPGRGFLGRCPRLVWVRAFGPQRRPHLAIARSATPSITHPLACV